MKTCQKTPTTLPKPTTMAAPTAPAAAAAAAPSKLEIVPNKHIINMLLNNKWS